MRTHVRTDRRSSLLALAGLVASLSVVTAPPAVAACSSRTVHAKPNPSQPAPDHASGASGTIGDALADGCTKIYLSGGTYPIKSQLLIPSSTTLTVTSGSAKSVIRADFSNGTMLRLNGNNIVIDGTNGSSTRRLELNANARAAHAINAATGKSGLTVRDATIHRTSSTACNNTCEPHLVNIRGSRNVTVTGNLFRNAGMDAARNYSYPRRTAAALSLQGNRGLTASNNDIAWTRSAGIDITGSFGDGGRVLPGGNTFDNVLVEYNVIRYTGRNSDVNGAYSATKGVTADGITGYSNHAAERVYQPAYYQMGRQRFFKIRNNTIQAYGNNGIHVSGTEVRVDSNVIGASSGGYRGHLTGIRIDDNRSNDGGTECSRDIVVRWNTVYDGTMAGKTATGGSNPNSNRGVYTRYWDRDAQWIYSNSPGARIDMGVTCTGAKL